MKKKKGLKKNKKKNDCNNIDKKKKNILKNEKKPLRWWKADRCSETGIAFHSFLLCRE